MNTKFCPDCNKELEVSSFGKNRAKKDGLQSICRLCKKDYNDNCYKNNKQYYIDKAKASNERVGDWYRLLKSGLKCMKCGEDHPACLHFHHRDPKQKEFTIASNVKVRGKKTLIKEIEKCDVLCANCHAKLHHEEKHTHCITL